MILAGGLAGAPLQRIESGIELFVPGRPRTKGSLKPVHVNRGAGRCSVSLTESGQYSEPWKKQMIARIGEACACERWPGPVRVDTLFLFQRLSADELLAFPTRQTGALGHGDLDKLERNVLDALTQSGLILDDSLVVDGARGKRFALPVDEAGVWITVRRMEDL